MIKIVAKNFVKEGKTGEFLALANKLVEETNRNDEGCIKYELFQDVDNPNIFVFIEEWDNKAVLDKHMAAKHFLEIVPKLDELAQKQSEINLFKKV